jgi:hypothetical protein
MSSIAEAMGSMARGGGHRPSIGGRMGGDEEEQNKSQSEHESPVHEHLAAMHKEMGGKHMHIHQNEHGEHTTHQVGEDGKVEGPHNHENTEALKHHMDKFLGEEEQEGGYGGHERNSGGGESLFG